MYRLFVTLFLLLTFYQHALPAGQNSLAVRFTNAPSRSTQIGVFVRQGTLYCSLNDLASVLLVKTHSDPKEKKFDVETAKFTMTVSANNPFVVLTDRDSTTSVRQLPYNVLYGAASYFIPLVSFLPILNSVSPDEFTLDPGETLLTIGHPAEQSAFDVTGLSIEEKDNGMAVRLHSKKPLKNYESWLKPMEDRTWLYITVDNARADTNALRTVKPSGPVDEIMVFPYPSSFQIIIKLRMAASGVEPMRVGGSNDILFAVHVQPSPQPETKPAPPASNGKEAELSETLERERNRWKLDCIVIDAGHGGEDPGTIGVTRTKEKDITLGIALKLGKLIEKNLRGVKVVYTRKTDEFIELYRRGQIANAAGGKLFISIHCNAAPHKPSPAHGFEIYLLRPGKTANALRIAERENDVVKLEKDYETRYQSLTEEHFILLTMAQSAYVKYSETFADILAKEMKSHTGFEDNGVKQAGFYVLVGASMPNVLIETAYLSNRHDEKILKGGTGQQQVAESIFAGVKRYKEEYEKALSEGKDIGTAE